MTFQVEDGTASATSTSYASVQYADAYHAKVGNVDWPTDTDDDTIALKEMWLNQATYSLDTLYGQQYKSVPVTQAQALLFPRMGFYMNQTQFVGSTTIPRNLKDATCEVALKACLSLDLYPDTAEEQNVKAYTKTVDVITKSVTFAGTSGSTEQHAGFYKVEQILNPVLKSSTSSPRYFKR